MSTAASNGLGTTIKYLKRTVNDHSPAMHNERRRGNGLGTTIKYL
jgi:hypothetical protein